ncbi:VWA-like domain-containing protein [Pendulispora rubella]|uniref:VWA-like domain-containing protein n=1 Tax=Pendulispora rubella TaxID=2741070 RepID=A0ABZ2KWK8_9BACT
MSQRLALARRLVQEQAPYWSSALHGFVYVAVKGCKTMFVTAKGVLGYDPEFVDREDEADVACGLAHEIVHFLLGHPARRQHREPRLWNKAADLATNDLLLRAKWPLPEWFLFPDSFGLPAACSAEVYYDQLTARGADAHDAPKKPGDGDQARSSSEATAKQLASPKPHRGPPAIPGGGCCGGISGAPYRQEIEEELDREHARSASARERLRRQVAVQIREHVKTAGHGSVPADLVEWAHVELTPRLPTWQEELSSAIAASVGRIRSGATDYSLRRPSRRSLLRGVLRPGLVDWAPEVAFVIDTSGSMTLPLFQKAMQEAARIARVMDLDEVWLAQADAVLARPFARVSPRSLVGNLRISGRGGTDFRPALARAHQLEPFPDLVVYFTDGDGAAPVEPPKFQVVWCLIGEHTRRPAAWGRPVWVADSPHS